MYVFGWPEFWLSTDCSEVMVGYDNLIYGHAVPGEGGKDGITGEHLQNR